MISDQQQYIARTELCACFKRPRRRQAARFCCDSFRKNSSAIQIIPFTFHPGCGLFKTIHVRSMRRCAVNQQAFLPLERIARTSIHGAVRGDGLIFRRR
jgi:hypothetical protein